MLQINQLQWKNICVEGLGLRSCNETEINLLDLGIASYSMDMNRQYCFMELPPNNWINLLNGTLIMIKSFENSSQRYLTIINGSRGNSFEYDNCFPKCSSRTCVNKVLAQTIISDKSVDELAQWVIDNIPK